MPTPDELWMEHALREAARAQASGEVPIGAVVVRDGKIIGRGWNRPTYECDASAHAEIIALREAGREIGNYRLNDCELFVTLEPCAMCAGAITHARIRRLIYAADDPKSGAVQSAMQVLNHQALNHRVEVTSGVLAGRAMEMLQGFFREKRK
jgi:tRNA(adenine34) deaminase